MNIKSEISNSSSQLLLVLDQNIEALIKARDSLIETGLASSNHTTGDILGEDGLRMDRLSSRLTFISQNAQEIGLEEGQFARLAITGARLHIS